MSHYDKDGKPISFEEWSRLFEDINYRTVERTELPGGFVSTVWLGLDHSFGHGQIKIFETMAFPSQDCRRYATLEEAIAGHAEVVAELAMVPK